MSRVWRANAAWTEKLKRSASAQLNCKSCPEAHLLHRLPPQQKLIAEASQVNASSAQFSPRYFLCLRSPHWCLHDTAILSVFLFFSVSAWCNFSPAASPSAWPYEQLRLSVVARESCPPHLCLPVAVSHLNGQLLVSEALSCTISKTSETIPTCRRHR